LGLHRQHGGKLNHVGCNNAPSVAQNGWQEMLSVNRVEDWTLHFFRSSLLGVGHV
jgi:hypothetical protein